jgi:hypothetical protein
VALDPPCGVYNCAHKASDFFVGGAHELAWDGSSPGGVGVVVDVINDVLEVLGLLGVKHLGY